MWDLLLLRIAIIKGNNTFGHDRNLLNLVQNVLKMIIVGFLPD